VPTQYALISAIEPELKKGYPDSRLWNWDMAQRDQPIIEYATDIALIIVAFIGRLTMSNWHP
jgi:hypothetical protein